MSSDSISLVTGSFWQGTDPFIVWQMHQRRKRDEAFERSGKLFLLLDLQPQRQTLQFVDAKPANLMAGGNIAALLRKFAPRGELQQILYDASEEQYWLPLQRLDGSVFPTTLRVCLKPVPELSLIVGGDTVYFRYGTRGSFTHRKTLDPPLTPAALQGIDILPDLIGKWLERSLAEMPEPEEETTGTLAPSLLQKQVRHRLKRRIKTIRQTLEKQISKAPSEEELASLTLHAETLKRFAYLYDGKSDYLRIPADLANSPSDVVLEVDPDRGIGSTLAETYTRLKRQRHSFKMGSAHLAKTKAELEAMETDCALLEREDLPAAALAAMLERYRLPLSQQSTPAAGRNLGEDRIPYRTFLSSTGVPLLVGKGATENDVLVKQARANDWWFHIVEGIGSHVIVSARSLPGPELPTVVQREAAILALHFSPWRRSAAGEVYVARKAGIRKRKGMAPGLWSVERASTIFVRFEPEELAALLNRQKIEPQS